MMVISLNLYPSISISYPSLKASTLNKVCDILSHTESKQITKVDILFEHLNLWSKNLYQLYRSPLSNFGLISITYYTIFYETLLFYVINNVILYKTTLLKFHFDIVVS